MNPVIQLTDLALIKLTAWAHLTKGKEFSGLGLVERDGAIFRVLDVDLLGVGSSGFTEFGPERQRALPLDERRKLWFHRHPINGWSATDENTAVNEPLGGIPQLVRWSVAIVLTPGGWVGRVDIHVPKHTVYHCAVEPNVPTPETIEQAIASITPETIALVDELRDEFYGRQPRTYRSYPVWNNVEGYDLDDIDWLEELDVEFMRECTREECDEYLAELGLTIDDLPLWLQSELQAHQRDQEAEEGFIHHVINYLGRKFFQ